MNNWDKSITCLLPKECLLSEKVEKFDFSEIVFMFAPVVWSRFWPKA
jgi:hypothetical protein